MKFTRDFLAAVSSWQSGWAEDQDERLKRAEMLKEHCAGVSQQFKHAAGYCYRKRFLHSSELEDIIVNGSKDDGVTSWTRSEEYAKRFKGRFKETAVAGAIFRHSPKRKNIILNIKALWSEPEFVKAAQDFRTDDPQGAEGLFNFGPGKEDQDEVILDVPLRSSEIVALTGVSSPFDDLCDFLDIPEEQRLSELKRIQNLGHSPGQWVFAPTDSVQRILSTVREAYLRKRDS